MRFPDFLKSSRVKAGLGQRELARLLNVSPSYLNELENGKRPAPSQEILTSLIKALEINEDEFYDLAGLSRVGIAPDLLEYVKRNNNINALIRTIKNLNFTDIEIANLKTMIATQNYKAIIIAAGLGSRLGELTKNLPKCMLDIGGESILRRQLNAYRANGINDISVVRGYQGEKIDYPKLKYYENIDYENNNILNSLFCAEEEIKGNVLISYSDIVFAPHVVERLLDSTADISIVVDVDWRGSYEHRTQHPIEEAENVIFDANHSVQDIGKILTNPGDVHGEFIGLLKLTPKGAEIFKKHFARSKKLFWDKQFQRAKTFQQAYITDFLKDMVDLGVPIHSVIIEQGWLEIDTAQDLDRAINKVLEW